jgi:hypothetical protein
MFSRGPLCSSAYLPSLQSGRIGTLLEVDIDISTGFGSRTQRESGLDRTASSMQKMVNSRHEVGDSERLGYRVVHASDDGVVGLFGSSVCADGNYRKPAANRVAVLGIQTPVACVGIETASPR